MKQSNQASQSVRLSAELMSMLRSAAATERRPLRNLVEILLQDALEMRAKRLQKAAK
jgi:hypothetical protein